MSLNLCIFFSCCIFLVFPVCDENTFFFRIDSKLYIKKLKCPWNIKWAALNLMKHTLPKSFIHSVHGYHFTREIKGILQFNKQPPVGLIKTLVLFSTKPIYKLNNRSINFLAQIQKGLYFQLYFTQMPSICIYTRGGHSSN